MISGSQGHRKQVNPPNFHNDGELLNLRWARLERLDTQLDTCRSIILLGTE